MLGAISSAAPLPSLFFAGQALWPLAQGEGPLLPPLLILVLCVVAGLATILLLPGRREAALRNIGGVILLAVLAILAALLVRVAAGRSQYMNLYFWIFSAIALIGAARVITHPRPVYSALYFILTVFATAGLFILLWAEFMAAALVLIYAGAILITYVFVIMLATQASSPGDSAAIQMTEYDAVSREPVVAAAVGFALMGILLFVIFDKAQGLVPPMDRVGNVAGGAVAISDMDPLPLSGNTQRLGVFLFSDQLVNLELAGLLLTVAMVGAILIARRQVYMVDAPRGVQPEVVTAKMTPVNDDPYSIPVYGTENPRQKEYPET